MVGWIRRRVDVHSNAGIGFSHSISRCYCSASLPFTFAHNHRLESVLGRTITFQLNKSDLLSIPFFLRYSSMGHRLKRNSALNRSNEIKMQTDTRNRMNCVERLTMEMRSPRFNDSQFPQNCNNRTGRESD